MKQNELPGMAEERIEATAKAAAEGIARHEEIARGLVADPLKLDRESALGTEPHKLHRGAPDTSIEAAEAVDTTRGEYLVLCLTCGAGVLGITNSEVATMLEKPVHAVSGRWSALLEKGLVEDSGRRRENERGRRERIMTATAAGYATVLEHGREGNSG